MDIVSSAEADPLAEIRGIGLTRANIEQLVTQMRQRRGMGLFVGAGMSIPFGLKGWQDFLLASGAAAGIREPIRQRLQLGEYEEAAQDLFDKLGGADPVQVLLMQEYGPNKLQGIEFNGAMKFLPQLATGPMITTNFDQVLERAFEKAGAPFGLKVVSGTSSDQVAYHAAFENTRCLVKLHGDVEKPWERVLTLNEYQNSYGGRDPSEIDFERPLPKLLKHLLTIRPVLFLGCSLNRDRVIKLAKRLVETSDYVHYYAVVQQPRGETAFLDTQKNFGAHHIRPIWYPEGRHEFVELILKFLSEQMVEAK